MAAPKDLLEKVKICQENINSNHTNCSALIKNYTHLINSSELFDEELMHRYETNRTVSYEVFILLLWIYLILIIIGSTGNSLVVLSVVRNAAMRTPRNLFILNLAISDLLLCTVTIPFTLYEVVTQYYTLPPAMCPIIGALQAISIFLPTLSICAIALDRYYIILYPMKRSLQTKGVFLVILGIWIVSIGLSSPQIIFKNVNHHDLQIESLNLEYIAFCNEEFPFEYGRFYYSVFIAVIQYVTPLLVMSCSYIKIYFRLKQRLSTKVKKKEDQKRSTKTNVLLVSIALIFAISWLPWNVLNLYSDAYMTFDDSTYAILFSCCHMLGMSSACSNPMLYGWLNENFRKEFHDICFCKAGKPRDTFLSNSHVRTSKTHKTDLEMKRLVTDPQSLEVSTKRNASLLTKISNKDEAL